MVALQLYGHGFSPALRIRRSAPLPYRPSALSLRCSLQEGGGESNGEERPELLFMKELKRRGLRPISLLEEGDGGGSIGSTESKEESREQTKRKNVTSAELEKEVLNQRERFVLLNSEGFEGLIPRGKVLLTIGGTLFLGFWPLILITLGLFLALYIYFFFFFFACSTLGPSFAHDGSKVLVLPTPYMHSYTLLEDASLSQVTPHQILN